jgi:hypothetical protein
MEDLARTRWTNPVAKSVGPACVRARVVCDHLMDLNVEPSTILYYLRLLEDYQ